MVKQKKIKEGILKDWVIKIDNKMRWQGDTDYNKKIIRINKRKSKKKSSVASTVRHEVLHVLHPKMPEHVVLKKEKKSHKKFKKFYV